MASNSIFVNGQYSDLSPLFELFPRNNYLLSNLNIFDSNPVASKRVILQDLTNSNKSLLNEPMSRFSSAHNVTARAVDLQRLIELPYFPRRDTFTPADVMDKRAIGTDYPVEETEADLAQEYLTKHQIAFTRTNEKAFARCLFAGESYDTKEFDTVINWGEVFGQERLAQSFDFSSTTVNPAFVIEQLISDIELKADGLAGSINRFVVFCTADFYSSFRYNTVFAETLKYNTSVFDPRNPIYQQQELLSNASFDIPGSNVTLVKVTDPLIAQFLPESGAVLIPFFTAGTHAYDNFYGAGSGNFGYLGTSQEFYSYGYKNQENTEYSVVSENSFIPVNRVFGLSAVLTQA